MASAQDTVYKRPTRIAPRRTPSARCASAESITSARPTGYSTVVTAFATSRAPVYRSQPGAARQPHPSADRHTRQLTARPQKQNQKKNQKQNQKRTRSGTGSTEPRRLQAEQLRVPPSGRDQRGMVALLEQPALVQHADVIGAPDGGEPMRDDQRRGALGDLQEPVEEVGLAPGIQPGGRLVQHQDRGAVPHREQRAGQRDPLPLPAGQLDPAVVGPRQHRVPPRRPRQAGKRRQHVQRPRPPGRVRQPRNVGHMGRRPESDVLGERQRVVREVLEHHRYLALPLGRPHPQKVNPVHQDPPGIRIALVSRGTHECQRRVDRGDIAWVTGNDGMSPVARADGHAHVHYVGRPSSRAPGTHAKRRLSVERNDRRC